MATKKVINKEVTNLVAFAPFEFGGKNYEPGDAFNLPAGYVRDTAFDEFRSIERKNKGEHEIGMAFLAPPVIDPGRKEPTERRSILPVKEA